MTAQVAVFALFGVVVLVAGIWTIVRRLERTRTDALKQASEAMGLVFETEGDPGRLRAIADLPLFDRGHSRRLRNVMTGRVGDREMKIFDYRYTVGGGKNSHTYEQTVAFYPNHARGTPDLTLAPETVLHKIGQLFGYRDIDFESNPAFSSRYLLRGSDETAIRSAFGPGVLGFFEQQPGWTVEVRSGSVGIYRSGKRVKPDDLSTFREDTQAIVKTLARK